jgi:hypothetical protein
MSCAESLSGRTTRPTLRARRGLGEELDDVNTQKRRDARQARHGEVLASTLDTLHVPNGNVELLGELLLRPRTTATELCDPAAKSVEKRGSSLRHAPRLRAVGTRKHALPGVGFASEVTYGAALASETLRVTAQFNVTARLRLRDATEVARIIFRNQRET